MNHADLAILPVDMGDIVSTLPKDSEELIRYLSEDGSMNEQVEVRLRRVAIPMS